MANVKQADFDIPKNSKLTLYSLQLMDIMKKTDFQNDFNNFVDHLFLDCCAYVKNHLNPEEPVIKLVFIAKQAEYERIEKQSNYYSHQREKPKGQTLGFAMTSNLENVIYLNFEPLTRLMLKNLQTFVFNLAALYIHEILHCYYRSIKDEQETLDLTYKLLGNFLGMSLPKEMTPKASDFYTEDNLFR